MTQTTPLPVRHRPTTGQWLLILPVPLLEAAMVLSWSSGFVGARFSIDHAPAMLVLFWRCLTVTLVLLPWVSKRLLRASPGLLLHNVGIGLFAMVGYLLGIIGGIALGVPAGLTALIADLLPIGTALLACTVLRQRLGWRTWAGLATGLVGVLLVGHDALAWGKAPMWAYALPLLGMLSLAVATLWQKHTAEGVVLGMLPSLCLQCAVASLVFGAIAGRGASLWPPLAPGFVISVLWAAGLSTLGGYGLYWLCLQRTSATRVASVLFLSPPLTLLWAWAMFDEPLSWLMLLGTLVSALGIWAVLRAQNPP